jgi:hypothetical protein
MFEAVIAFLGIVVGAYLQKRYAGKEERRKNLEELQKYLRNLSSYLDQMVEKLDKDEVPTRAGRNFEKAIENFKGMYQNLGLPDSRRRELIKVHEQLKLRLTEGRFLDDVIRGNARLRAPDEKEKILSEMKRTSAYISGTADTLQAFLF